MAPVLITKLQESKPEIPEKIQDINRSFLESIYIKALRNICASLHETGTHQET